MRCHGLIVNINESKKLKYNSKKKWDNMNVSQWEAVQSYFLNLDKDFNAY